MTEEIVLIRNGYGNWFLKDTPLNDTPKGAAALVKSLCCAENVTETSDDK